MASLVKRGSTFYAQYYVGKKLKRVSLATSSLQVAKEKLRQLESSMFHGEDSPLPTKTPLHEIIQKYLFHLKARTSERNVQKITTYQGGFDPMALPRSLIFLGPPSAHYGPQFLPVLSK